MSVDNVAFFVKFIDSQWVDSFVNEGVLYMNSLKYFREEEDKLARGDELEGTSIIANGANSTVHISGKKLGGFIKGKIVFDYEESINIFSMVAVRDSAIKNITTNQVLKFNPLFKNFGDTAIIITRENIPTFIKRIKSSFNKNSYIYQVRNEPYWAGAVNYVDDDFSGRYGPFKKNQSQSWQSEWRIAILRGAKHLKPKPYKLKIGSISDVCVKISTETLINEGIRLD
ncbi:hypothetical protein [Legionella longbeachae]|uniref:hypothetical protein n=1 Tax=Legionella longbeachae TaxID=450 RepID=UPI00399D42C9